MGKKKRNWMSRIPGMRPKAKVEFTRGPSPAPGTYIDHLMAAGVPREEVNNCMMWALGPNWISMNISDTPEVWNKRHGDLHHMKDTDSRAEGYKIIAKLYLSRHKPTIIIIDDPAAED